MVIEYHYKLRCQDDKVSGVVCPDSKLDTWNFKNETIVTPFMEKMGSVEPVHVEIPRKII